MCGCVWGSYQVWHYGDYAPHDTTSWTPRFPRESTRGVGVLSSRPRSARRCCRALPPPNASSTPWSEKA
jgi:hypothetical protein